MKRETVQSVVLGPAWTGYQSKDALINRNGQTFPLSSVKGQDDFYANLEDYVRLLQGLGAKVYLIRGVPGSRPRFDPTKMVTRSVTGFRINPDFDKPESIVEMRAIHEGVDAKLAVIADRTGAKVLDLFVDVCGSGDGCLPLFGKEEPKFTDEMHLRPIFVKGHLHFLDFLLT